MKEFCQGTYPPRMFDVMTIVIPSTNVNGFSLCYHLNGFAHHLATHIHNVYVHFIKAKGLARDNRLLKSIIKITITCELR